MDSEYMKNADRARRALECGGYEKLENTLNLKLPTPDGDEVDAHSGYPISDLICDLFALCKQHDLNPADMIREAWEHHGSDIIEQAHQYDDGWDNLLQTEENGQRARELLALHHIPEEHWDGIFSKTGLDNCP